MAKKTAAKRSSPRKPRFGEDDRSRAWSEPDGFTWFHQPSLPVTHEQVQEIAATLGVPMNSEHVAAWLAAICLFDGRETAMAALPDGVRRARDIKTLAALARAMDGLNANVRAALVRHGIDLGNYEPTQVAEAARQAAMEMERARIASSGPGRPPKSSREATLLELDAIYEQAMGRPGKLHRTSGSDITKAGRPTGHFFEFMRAAVKPVPGLNTLNDDALYQAVKRARGQN